MIILPFDYDWWTDCDTTRFGIGRCLRRWRLWFCGQDKRSSQLFACKNVYFLWLVNVSIGLLTILPKNANVKVWTWLLHKNFLIYLLNSTFADHHRKPRHWPLDFQPKTYKVRVPLFLSCASFFAMYMQRQIREKLCFSFLAVVRSSTTSYLQNLVS